MDLNAGVTKMNQAQLLDYSKRVSMAIQFLNDTLTNLEKFTLNDPYNVAPVHIIVTESKSKKQAFINKKREVLIELAKRSSLSKK